MPRTQFVSAIGVIYMVRGCRGGAPKMSAAETKTNEAQQRMHTARTSAWYDPVSYSTFSRIFSMQYCASLSVRKRETQKSKAHFFC